MKVLKYLSVTIVALVLLILGGGMLLPSDYHVERSITINAPANEIYPDVADLRAWKAWGVWFERDPNMTLSYEGEGIGQISRWQSATEGNGEMEVLALVPNESMTYALRFPDFDMGSEGKVSLESTTAGTKVTWENHGDVGAHPLNRYFAYFMDDMIGADFEQGLAKLKQKIEQN